MFCKIEKNKKVLIYLGIFLLIQILYHLSFKAYFGDDYKYFSKVLENNSLLEWLRQRYDGWSSRVIIEAMLAFFAKNIFIWKIANILVNFLMAYSLYKLSHNTSLFAVLALVVLYPVFDMGSAGWIATFMNYFWPLAFGLYSLIVPDKLIREERARWWEILSSFIAAIIAVNVEQYCVVHIALLVPVVVGLFTNKTFHKIWIVIGHYLIAFSSLIFILLAPGNVVRESREVVSWMKDFYEKTIVDKFIDGFERTFSIILSSTNIIFAVFCVFLFACIWKKTKNVYYRFIGGFPLLVVGLVSFRQIHANSFWGDLINTISSNAGVTAQNYIKISSYIPVVIYCLVAAGIIMGFFIVLDEFFKALECSFIFCTAIVSGIVMGFSPTLFISDKRTLIFCYFLLIVLIMKLIEYSPNLFSDKEKNIGRIVISITCILTVLNNIVCAGYRG